MFKKTYEMYLWEKIFHVRRSCLMMYIDQCVVAILKDETIVMAMFQKRYLESVAVFSKSWFCTMP